MASRVTINKIKYKQIADFLLKFHFSSKMLQAKRFMGNICDSIEKR